MAGADFFTDHFCYVVVFGNYHPPEVDSIWRAYHAAEARAVALNKEYRSTRWEVVEWKFGDAGVDYRCRSGDGERPPSPQVGR